LRTKNIEYTLLVLRAILKIYENSGSLKIRRGNLLEVCKTAYANKYHGVTDLGHSTFSRCLHDLEEELAIRTKKVGTKNTTLIINLDKVKKMLNEMNSKLGFYSKEEKLTIEDIESKTLEPFLKQLADAMLENYSNPWLSTIDEQSQDAHLITQRCASKIFAKLFSSRFGFTLSTLNDSNFKTIEKNYLYELGIVTSKIASSHLQEPFQLLIDYSGIPDSNDWGIITEGELWSMVVIHFELFTERVFQFNLSIKDLKSLQNKHPDKMTKAAIRLFDIFRDNYLLPTLRAMSSKNIKFDNGIPIP
jgi:hypothetical protein